MKMKRKRRFLCLKGKTLLLLSLTEISLRELAKKAAGSFERELKDKGLSLNISGASSAALADRDRISHVMINLISNASK